MNRSLAILAVLFLLLRPVCDALADGHAHAESGHSAHAVSSADSYAADQHGGIPCCLELEDRALVKSGEPAANRAGTDGKVDIHFAVMRTAAVSRAAPPPDPRQPPGANFTTLSYYARSARILR